MAAYFHVILAFVASFALTSVSGVWAIPFLKKLKLQERINEIGPSWHKSKKGTPTMGGTIFIFGILVGLSLAVISFLSGDLVGDQERLEISRLISGVVMSLCLGLIGFVDDYIKLVRRGSDGLSEGQKTLLQMLVILMFLWSLFLGGTRTTVFWIPFMGALDVGLFYYPLSLIIIYGTINAVNFTDGIDGLCTGVTGIVGIGFVIACGMLQFPVMSLLASAMVGGCFGFFLWNRHPAKVFMGDTGSLFLGGLVVTLAYGLNRPFLIALFGIAYLWEIATVFIQRYYYKLTKKRIFKMTPIHHSFEMSGYSENKIVFLFALVTTAGVALGLVALYLT